MRTVRGLSLSSKLKKLHQRGHAPLNIRLYLMLKKFAVERKATVAVLRPSTVAYLQERMTLIHIL
ncbi:hypothetical protein EH196_19390 [Bacillus sp. C1-1]|nr:hypothetical protein EH196_19390 [Bacillus sp. C1-1]